MAISSQYVFNKHLNDALVYTKNTNYLCKTHTLYQQIYGHLVTSIISIKLSNVLSNRGKAHSRSIGYLTNTLIFHIS